MLKGDFKYIFFDADDTLWQNEEYFREAERKFAHRMSGFTSPEEAVRIITEKQEENIPVFGYGSKTLLIGMLDAAAEICGAGFDAAIYRDLKQFVRELAYHELHLMDGVEETLEALSGKYILAIATKGDLIEQQTKYHQSGLDRFFHHIEVLPTKSESDYLAMARKLGIKPENILMVGNSIKSDIAPVINIGGTAIHIPYKVTWIHEIMDMPESDRVFEVKSLKNLPNLLL